MPLNPFLIDDPSRPSFTVVPDLPARTEMRCRRCGGFSSAQVCGQCVNYSNNPYPPPPSNFYQTEPVPSHFYQQPLSQPWPGILQPTNYPLVPINPFIPTSTPQDTIDGLADLLRVIGDLKAGNAPADEFEEFEEMLAKAIEENRQRDESKAKTQEHPTRFEREDPI